jgi:septin 6/8/11
MLRVIETAGFGDQLDKEKRFILTIFIYLGNIFSARVITNYINQQFEAYLKEELKVKRNLAYYHDTRIHICLYFISPTGHG